MTQIYQPSSSYQKVVLSLFSLCLIAVASLPLFNALHLTPPAFFNVPTGILFITFSFLHGGKRIGWLSITILLLLTIPIAFTTEYLGSTRGYFYGDYNYSSAAGIKLFDQVPLIIPFCWFMMIYPSFLITNILVGQRNLNHLLSMNGLPFLLRYPILVIIDAMVMTAWDVFVDPIWTRKGVWSWTDVRAGDGFFGVPAMNFLGWLETTIVIFALFRGFRYIYARHTRGTEVVYGGKYANLPVGIYGFIMLIGMIEGIQFNIPEVTVLGFLAMGAFFIPASLRLLTRNHDAIITTVQSPDLS